MDGTELASLTGLGGVGKWVHAEAQRRREAYHSPPASLIAFSKARLDGVRFVPELRGRSGSASSARRLASAALKAGKSTRRPVHAGAVCGSVFKRFDAMLVHRFFADAALKIHAVQRHYRSDQRKLLFIIQTYNAVYQPLVSAIAVRTHSQCHAFCWID